MKKQNDNNSLVEGLIKEEILNNPALINAFHKIDRKDFVLLEEDEEIYKIDKNLRIGYGQTISEPMVVAFMLELLDLEETHKVLDIGTGSGYTTALISQVIGETGYVFGLEIIPALVSFGKENLKKYEIYNAFISKAGYDIGIRRKKFDRILISACAQEIPEGLLEQLEDDGKLVMSIKNSIYLIEKKDGKYFENRVADFDFEPLVIV